MYPHNAVWFILCVVGYGVVVDAVRQWGTVQQLPPDKIPDGAISTDRAIVKRKIVLYHNFFRSKVNPPASNMLLASWHKEAAFQAQRYAERCVFLQHNSPTENTVENLGACGQNLFVSSNKTPWFFAIKSWFLEYRNFTYGAPSNDFHETGHYSQMVWATSHKVGCGMALCPSGPWGQFYNYVCHYCPGGNIDGISQFPYKAGVPCEDCPGQCVSGLCTNACPKKDFFSNCAEMYSVDSNTCSRGVCNATCECGSQRVHKNYPWV